MATKKKPSSKKEVVIVEQDGNGNGVKGSLLINTFERTIEMQTDLTGKLCELTGKVERLCTCMESNQKVITEFVTAVGPVANVVRSNKRALSQIRFGLVPVIVSLVLIVFTLILKLDHETDIRTLQQQVQTLQQSVKK